VTCPLLRGQFYLLCRLLCVYRLKEDTAASPGRLWIAVFVLSLACLRAVRDAWHTHRLLSIVVRVRPGNHDVLYFTAPDWTEDDDACVFFVLSCYRRQSLNDPLKVAIASSLPSASAGRTTPMACASWRDRHCCSRHDSLQPVPAARRQWGGVLWPSSDGLSSVDLQHGGRHLSGWRPSASIVVPGWFIAR